jgi:hypothetical protein
MAQLGGHRVAPRVVARLVEEHDAGRIAGEPRAGERIDDEDG